MIYVPVRVTVPGLLIIVVFEDECTVHWKVVVRLIENTVNEYLKGVVGLFNWYIGLFTISSSLYDVPLIIHVTGNVMLLWYPQLMMTSLPSQTVLFRGGLVIITTEHAYDIVRSKQKKVHTVYMVHLMMIF